MLPGNNLENDEIVIASWEHENDDDDKIIVTSWLWWLVSNDSGSPVRIHIVKAFFPPVSLILSDSKHLTVLHLPPQVKLELIRQAENLEQVRDILEDKASEDGSPSTVTS